MASRRPPPPSGPGPGPGPGGPNAPQVFKPRASVLKFGKFFGPILVMVLVLLGMGTGVSYMLGQWFPKLFSMWWIMPITMSIPLVSVIGGAVYANRLTKARVVIDGQSLRILQGDHVEAHLAWSQITRLTVRQERGDNVYEVWVRDQAVPLPAAFFEDGEKLLQAVSARTRRPWERPRGA